MTFTLVERGAIICALSESVHISKVLQWRWTLPFRFRERQALTIKILRAQPRHMHTDLVFWEEACGVPLPLLDLEGKLYEVYQDDWEVIAHRVYQSN